MNRRDLAGWIEKVSVEEVCSYSFFNSGHLAAGKRYRSIMVKWHHKGTFQFYLLSSALRCPSGEESFNLLFFLGFCGVHLQLFMMFTKPLTRHCSRRQCIAQAPKSIQLGKGRYRESWEPQNGLPNPDNQPIRNSFLLFVHFCCYQVRLELEGGSCNCADHSRGRKIDGKTCLPSFFLSPNPMRLSGNEEILLA